MQGNEKETEGKRLIINQSHPHRINMHREGNTYIRFQIVCLLVGALTEKSLFLSPISILIDEKISGIKCNLCKQILSDLGPPWPPWFPLVSLGSPLVRSCSTLGGEKITANAFMRSYIGGAYVCPINSSIQSRSTLSQETN